MLQNLRNYWNQCKHCCVVYTSQCLTLVLHLISTLVNRSLKIVIVFLPEGLGMSITDRVLAGSQTPGQFIIRTVKLCSKMLFKVVINVILRMLLFSLPDIWLLLLISFIENGIRTQ